MQKTHFGYEQVDVDDKARRVRGVFDSIASRYDLLDRALPKRVDARSAGVLVPAQAGTLASA